MNSDEFILEDKFLIKKHHLQHTVTVIVNDVF